MTSPEHPIHWLQHAGQRLGLVPSLGGGVAAWQLDQPNGTLDLWRAWAGSTNRYTLASMPMLPWCNRISGGGFEHAGVFYPMRLNRAGEPYPIHGDGWLQPWQLQQTADNTLEMTLQSHAFDNNPYVYQALQRFVLLEGGMDQTLTVTHLGDQPMPYGLGQHPWLPRSAATRLSAPVQGVWLSGGDPLPTRHSHQFPPGWDPRAGMPVTDMLVDNVYTGWAGQATITWPEHALTLTMTVPKILELGQQDGYCLLYLPPTGAAFCLEPMTHPVDAFHLPGKPGLQVLQTGQNLSLQVQWRFARSA